MPQLQIYGDQATQTPCSPTENVGNGTQGDPTWMAFGKCNANFDELYAGAAGGSVQFTKVTANTTLSATTPAVLVDASASSITITVDTAVGATSARYIKRIDTSGNTVTIGTTSSQTIDGAATQQLVAQYAAIALISDNANWWMV